MFSRPYIVYIDLYLNFQLDEMVLNYTIYSCGDHMNCELSGDPHTLSIIYHGLLLLFIDSGRKDLDLRGVQAYHGAGLR